MKGAVRILLQDQYGQGHTQIVEVGSTLTITLPVYVDGKRVTATLATLEILSVEK